MSNKETNNMKKIILITAVLLVASFSTNAQETKKMPPAKNQERKNLSPEERAKADADRAEKKLGLNAQQKTDWEAASLKRIIANKPYQDKMRGSTTPEERKDLRAKMKENADKFDVTVSAFLTSEQKTKYEQFKKQREEGRNKKMKPGSEKEPELED